MADQLWRERLCSALPVAARRGFGGRRAPSERGWLSAFVGAEKKPFKNGPDCVETRFTRDIKCLGRLVMGVCPILTVQAGQTP